VGYEGSRTFRPLSEILIVPTDRDYKSPGKASFFLGVSIQSRLVILMSGQRRTNDRGRYSSKAGRKAHPPSETQIEALTKYAAIANILSLPVAILGLIIACLGTLSSCRESVSQSPFEKTFPGITNQDALELKSTPTPPTRERSVRSEELPKQAPTLSPSPKLNYGPNAPLVAKETPSALTRLIRPDVRYTQAEPTEAPTLSPSPRLYYDPNSSLVAKAETPPALTRLIRPDVRYTRTEHYYGSDGIANVLVQVLDNPVSAAIFGKPWAWISLAVILFGLSFAMHNVGKRFAPGAKIG
jgi:hypothetical protein